MINNNKKSQSILQAIASAKLGGKLMTNKLQVKIQETQFEFDDIKKYVKFPKMKYIFLKPKNHVENKIEVVIFNLGLTGSLTDLENIVMHIIYKIIKKTPPTLEKVYDFILNKKKVLNEKKEMFNNMENNLSFKSKSIYEKIFSLNKMDKGLYKLIFCIDNILYIKESIKLIPNNWYILIERYEKIQNSFCYLKKHLNKSCQNHINFVQYWLGEIRDIICAKTLLFVFEKEESNINQNFDIENLGRKIGFKIYSQVTLKQKWKEFDFEEKKNILKKCTLNNKWINSVVTLDIIKA